MKKKKYTIIYSDYVGHFNHRIGMVQYIRVATDNLSELLEEEKFVDNIYYIFNGWPKLEGE